MKKLLIVLCAGAFIVSACSSEQAPVAAAGKYSEASAPVKHKHHRHASGINCNK